MDWPLATVIIGIIGTIGTIFIKMFSSTKNKKDDDMKEHGTKCTKKTEIALMEQKLISLENSHKGLHDKLETMEKKLIEIEILIRTFFDKPIKIKNKEG